MNDSHKQEHLSDIDRVLGEVRDQLDYSHEQEGDVYELRALQLLLHVVKAMHSEHDVYALIALILDSALSFAEADRAFLMLLDDGGQPRFKMGRSYGGESLTQDDFVISQSVVAEALAGQTAVIVADAQKDAVFSMRQSVHDLQLRTIMATPLIHNGRVTGLIYVDSPRPLGRYTRHHFNVLNSLADQAAVAIANARKFETHG